MTRGKENPPRDAREVLDPCEPLYAKARVLRDAIHIPDDPHLNRFWNDFLCSVYELARSMDVAHAKTREELSAERTRREKAENALKEVAEHSVGIGYQDVECDTCERIIDIAKDYFRLAARTANNATPGGGNT
jgi:hypothetical protein